MKFGLNIRIIAATGLLIVMLLTLAQPALGATSGEITDVAREFICNCGCNKMLPACDMQCGKDFKKIIGQKIDADWNRKKIVDYMIKNYNEQILSAPTKKGFNLVAWIMPFVVLGLAGAGVAMVIVAWGKGAEKKEEERLATVAAEAKKSAESDKKDDKYRKQLDEELKKHDW